VKTKVPRECDARRQHDCHPFDKRQPRHVPFNGQLAWILSRLLHAWKSRAKAGIVDQIVSHSISTVIGVFPLQAKIQRSHDSPANLLRRGSSRRRPPMCLRSSAARPSICKRCSIHWLGRQSGCATPNMPSSGCETASPTSSLLLVRRKHSIDVGERSHWSLLPERVSDQLRFARSAGCSPDDRGRPSGCDGSTRVRVRRPLLGGHEFLTRAKLCGAQPELTMRGSEMRVMTILRTPPCRMPAWKSRQRMRSH
jgi:hypothetical protein